MQTTESSAKLIDELMDPLGECLSPEVARRIVQLRAGPALEERIHFLGQKCSEGALTPLEQADYETIVRFVKFISTLQSKARTLIQTSVA